MVQVIYFYTIFGTMGATFITNHGESWIDSLSHGWRETVLSQVIYYTLQKEPWRKESDRSISGHNNRIPGKVGHHPGI